MYTIIPQSSCFFYRKLHHIVKYWSTSFVFNMQLLWMLSPIQLKHIMPLNTPYRLPQTPRSPMPMIRIGCPVLMKYNTRLLHNPCHIPCLYIRKILLIHIRRKPYRFTACSGQAFLLHMGRTFLSLLLASNGVSPPLCECGLIWLYHKNT